MSFQLTFTTLSGAAETLIKRNHMFWDFVPLKQVLAGSRAEVALVIPVSSEAGTWRFSLQNIITTPKLYV